MLRPLQQSEGHEQVTSRSLQNSALSLAWIIALVSTLGALFIGEVMGQTPCVLCWYQRIAMFPLALILGIAAYLEDTTIYRYVLPISIVGGLIAFWHSLLHAAEELVCNHGPLLIEVFILKILKEPRLLEAVAYFAVE